MEQYKKYTAIIFCPPQEKHQYFLYVKRKKSKTYSQNLIGFYREITLHFTCKLAYLVSGLSSELEHFLLLPVALPTSRLNDGY